MAPTPAQLQIAYELSAQIVGTGEHLRKIVQLALDARIEGVPLDQTVKDGLQTEYASTKAQLGSLVQQLP